ncbi:MAG: hypothetical protein AB7G10_24710, partial [Reyranellaceae bacterium]
PETFRPAPEPGQRVLVGTMMTNENAPMKPFEQIAEEERTDFLEALDWSADPDHSFGIRWEPADGRGPHEPGFAFMLLFVGVPVLAHWNGERLHGKFVVEVTNILYPPAGPTRWCSRIDVFFIRDETRN